MMVTDNNSSINKNVHDDDREHHDDGDSDWTVEFRSQLPDDPESISELTRELCVHPHVQNVQRVCLDFGPRKSEDHSTASRRASVTGNGNTGSSCSSLMLRSLMRELGSLPNLCDLELSNLGNGSSHNSGNNNNNRNDHSYGGFPLQWLSFFCQQSQRHHHNRCVESLRLRHCTLTASPRVMEQFATSLPRLEHLRELELWDCQLEEETRVFGTLDGVVQAAAQSLPHLKVLKLGANHCDRLGSLDARTIVELLHQPQHHAKQQHSSLNPCCNLQELQLKGFSWFGPDLVDIFAVVQHHATLQHLALDWCEFPDPNTAHALAKVLRTNATLKSLAIGTSTHYVWDALEFLKVLIQALKLNTTLKRFRLEHFDASCDPRRGSDENGTVQQQQQLSWNRDIGTAVLDMLESNVSLEDLSLSTHLQNNNDAAAEGLQQEMEFWLRLNRHGRARFHGRAEQIDRGEWMQILSDASEDLDCVFFVLQRHPFLVCR